jgi:MoaA/NifB/PqqE/SkfB family radical SAM enzyme
VGLDISAQGEFRPCCKYVNPVATNLKDYQNSQTLIDLKESFLKGEKPLECRRCWHDEEVGHTSKRLQDWKYIFNEVVPDLTKTRILMFPFGNSCNLACRTCDSHSSSTWIKESKKLQAHIPDIKIYKHHRFYKDKELIDQIKELSSNVTDIYFPGGEPFITGIDEHLDFLDHLITQNSKNITLHYITNATVFPSDQFWQRWNKFNAIKIQLSIDGLGKHFEYNRWPASWDQVQGNIKSYQSKKAVTSNLVLTVSHVVSVFTIYYFPEFFKWCLQNKFNHPYVSILYNPIMYDIRVLPASVKTAIRNKLSKYFR